MVVNAPSIKSHQARFIPVPDELLPESIADVECIMFNEKKYKHTDFFVYEKGDIFPSAMMMAVTGQNVDPIKFWNYYSKSKNLIIFICHESD